MGKVGVGVLGAVAVAGVGYSAYLSSLPPVEKAATSTVTATQTVTAAQTQAVTSTPTVAGIPPWLGKKKFPGATLTIKQFSWPPMDVYKLLIPAFEQATGAKVNYDGGVSWADLGPDVLRDLMSKAGKYDIVTQDVWALPNDYSYLRPVTDWVTRDWDDIGMDDFVPLKGALLQYDPTTRKMGEGDWWGLPFLVHGEMILYRKDLADAKGLDAPKTVYEFEQFAKALTNPPTTYGATLRGKRDHSIICDAYFTQQPFGGRFMGPVPKGHPLYQENPLVPTINAPETIEATEWFIHMLKDYCPPGQSEADDTVIAANADKGLAASMYGENWAPLFWDPSTYIGPNAKWAFTACPSGKYDYTGGAVCGCTMINGASKNQELAWEWIKWQVSKEAQRITIPAGGEPLRMSSLRDPDVVKAQPFLPAIEKSLSYTSKIQRPLFAENLQFEAILGLSLSEALIGTKTVKQALDEAQAKTDKLMKGAGYY
jgi:multiple sugar transport system substrate-binding protein